MMRDLTYCQSREIISIFRERDNPLFSLAQAIIYVIFTLIDQHAIYHHTQQKLLRVSMKRVFIFLYYVSCERISLCRGIIIRTVK